MFYLKYEEDILVKEMTKALGQERCGLNPRKHAKNFAEFYLLFTKHSLSTDPKQIPP